MNEENKYYTPDISEFHVGFACEWSEQGRKIWIEEIIDEDDLSDLCIGTDKIEYFRVKFLDREDIESCGFEYKHKSKIDEINYRLLFQFKGTDILLSFSDATPFQRICIEKNGGYSTVFLGYIKNKSELKKLLKQLGIND